MTAFQRSNVLKREEKGIGVISFRRLLVAGLGAIVFFVFASRIAAWGIGCLGGLALMVFLLVLTQPIGGFLLLVHAATVAQGLILVAVRRDPHRKTSLLIQKMLRVDPAVSQLNAERLFQGDRDSQHPDELADSTEWVIYRGDGGDGLAFVEDPVR